MIALYVFCGLNVSYVTAYYFTCAFREYEIIQLWFRGWRVGVNLLLRSKKVTEDLDIKEMLSYLHDKNSFGRNKGGERRSTLHIIGFETSNLCMQRAAVRGDNWHTREGPRHSGGVLSRSKWETTRASKGPWHSAIGRGEAKALAKALRCNEQSDGNIWYKGALLWGELRVWIWQGHHTTQPSPLTVDWHCDIYQTNILGSGP